MVVNVLLTLGMMTPVASSEAVDQQAQVVEVDTTEMAGVQVDETVEMRRRGRGPFVPPSRSPYVPPSR